MVWFVEFSASERKGLDSILAPLNQAWSCNLRAQEVEAGGSSATQSPRPAWDI